MSREEDKDRDVIPDDFTTTREAYCVKCKAKRNMKQEKQVTMKNGQSAISGTCTVCGTKMFKIGGGKKPAKRTIKVKRRKSGRTNIKRLRRV
jgi:Zn finger protein HypA/HybF involved in hydrogenase expression